MATFFEYKCKGCGYTVNANPKGKDMVMMGEIYNYLCQECKEIVDVLYPYGKKPEKIVCPECGSEKLLKAEGIDILCTLYVFQIFPLFLCRLEKFSYLCNWL